MPHCRFAPLFYSNLVSCPGSSMLFFLQLFSHRFCLDSRIYLYTVSCLLLVQFTGASVFADPLEVPSSADALRVQMTSVEQKPESETAAMPSDTNNETAEAQQQLQLQLEQLYFETEDKIGGEPIYTAGYLLDLYRKNQFSLLWDNPKSIVQLLKAIHASADDGLTPEDYHLEALIRYGHDVAGGASVQKQVEYDLLLSDAMLLLAHHKRDGKVDPRKVEDKKNLEPATPRPWPADAYLTAIKGGTVQAVLDKFSPHHPSYLNLKKALHDYRQFAARSVWQQIPGGQSLKPGMTDPRVTLIRNRLAVTGELAGRSLDSTFFDHQLETAVKVFQTRHHLEPDGIIGKATLRAMNITAAERIDQIRANLERTRWVVNDLPHSSLIVDIAGFMLQYYHNNEMIWTSKVMVGRPYHQTPVFRSAVTYLVLNPTWTPTPDIVKNETVPSIINDPEYLAKQRLRVLDSSGNEIDPETIPWRQYYGKVLPYTLRQDPGRDNSLGLIKFLFPNPYHVYLHDTPSKFLFGRTQRAFSHGCIRVQNPMELARLMLANDPGNPTTVKKIDQILASGKTTTVILKQPLPVYLMYLTTNVQDGQVLFKPDLYNRDEGVVAALNAPPSPLSLTVQLPETKAGLSLSGQQVRTGKNVRYVQNESRKGAESSGQEAL